MEIVDIFSNFLVIDYIDIPLENIKKHCVQISKSDSGRSISNHNGYQSNFIDLGNKNILELVSIIENKLIQIGQHIGMNTNCQYKITEMWVNINKYTNYNMPHTHAGLFSGVFYVEGNNADLVLMNQDNLKASKVDQNYVGNYSKYLASYWNINPEPKKLVIFPSWINHYVQPNLSKVPRISLSFNAVVL